MACEKVSRVIPIVAWSVYVLLREDYAGGEARAVKSP